MNLTKFKLIYHTVKHLRFKQIYYRFYYTIRNRFFKREYTKGLNQDIKPLIWKNKINYTTSYLGDNRFKFLNIEHRFNSKIDWNYDGYGKLWTYNLNYFDFLNQKDITAETGILLIEDYIKQNIQLKDGKEPYPISLRAINWIKFLSENKISNKKIIQSLYNHYQILLNNLEYHLLGNHLLENVFALFFGGLFFNDKTLSGKASKLLHSELKEQILNDGAHFELSPMYHQIVLHRLLDCICLSQQNNNQVNQELVQLLKVKAEQMLSWLQTVTFNNGTIPMVNDSAYGISLSTKQLFKYAAQLNLNWNSAQLKDSGYRKFSSSNLEVFMDVGQLAIDYQPGHAHADTFSFIVHANNRPIIVDPAVSTYEINRIRERERSTAYHNTVTINNENSSQVWSGFRVAKRAKVSIIVDELTKISASHNGFSNYRHTRAFSLVNSLFSIEDMVSKTTQANAHFHFHPGCEVRVVDRQKLIVKNIELIFFEHENFELQEYHFASGFNTTKIAKKVVVLFTEKLRTEIKVIS